MSSLITHPTAVRTGALTLRSADGSTEADFVPGANMICSSLRYFGAEYLHQGTGVEAYARDGLTMGIPLLHPWANRLSGFHYRVGGQEVVLPRGESLIPLDDIGLPIHGVMPGLMHWEVARLDRTALTAKLRWTSGELLRLFPFAHELTVEASLESGALTIVTTLAPLGHASVPVSFGYHPYLRIPKEERSGWEVKLAVRGHLLLDGAMIPTGEREPVARRRFTLAERFLDDGFDEIDTPAVFEAAAGDGAVKLEFLDGYPYAQVYAPAGHDFICFEPMTAPANALVSGDGLMLVAPGRTYRAAFRVSLFARSRTRCARN